MPLGLRKQKNKIMKKLLIISSLLAFMAISNSASAQFDASVSNTTSCQVQITFKDGGGAILFQYWAVPGPTAVGCTAGTVATIEFSTPLNCLVPIGSAGGTITGIIALGYCSAGACCTLPCTPFDNLTVTPSSTATCGLGTTSVVIC